MVLVWSHYFMANSDRLLLGAQKSLQMVIAAMKVKPVCSLEEKF